MTAGFGDLGFKGTITLEISVIYETRIYAGDRVCQVFFETVKGKRRFYQGRYQNQVEPAPSRMHLEGFLPSGD
jgi:dCTP deaminase